MTPDRDARDVLTTAKAAQLLGVSVRTAQLWVESGQLRSWKTPGGHRRIPRQAVLDLIAHTPSERLLVRAHALVLAGEGREADWRAAGLPGSGLLLNVTDDVQTFRKWLALTPPMLVAIENVDHEERGKLAGAIRSDHRFKDTVLVTLSESGPDRRNIDAPRRLRLGMLPDAFSTSAALVDRLRQTQPLQTDQGTFPTPWNEAARLEAVTQSGLVGSGSEVCFDRLVRLAAHATGAPIAMFTLITEKEQCFKSRIGFDGASTPRDWAFCNETLWANRLTVFEDLPRSGRFAQNPTLNEPFCFRFYAGAPVRDPLGYALGSVCVIDVVPRGLNGAEQEALTTIADAGSDLLRLRALEQESERSH